MLGALLDIAVPLGLSLDQLKTTLSLLDLPPWELHIEERFKMGIRGLKVTIKTSGEVEKPAQAVNLSKVEVLHSPPHQHPLSHLHQHPDQHSHGYSYKEIRDRILTAHLSEGVQRRSLEVFEALAEAEGKVHGCTSRDVHFHEVGMVDSVVDIVGSAWCLEWLQVKKIYSAPPPIGRGWIKCAHGVMPLPAPATSHLLEGLSIISTSLEEELVTPTGAAMLRVWTSKIISVFPALPIKAVGWGAGGRELPDRPNLLRVFLFNSSIESSVDQEPDQQPVSLPTQRCWKLEVNLDDITPELLAHLCGELINEGALDVWQTPIIMKKGRAAMTLSVLCTLEDLERMERLILQRSTSLGVRRSILERSTLPRSTHMISTPHGEAQVKIAWTPPRWNGHAHDVYENLQRDEDQKSVKEHEELESVLNIAPEYEDAARLAQSTGLPLKNIYSLISTYARTELQGGLIQPPKSS